MCRPPGLCGPSPGKHMDPQLALGQLPRAREGRPGWGLMSAEGTGAHGGLTGTEVPGRAAPLQARLPPPPLSAGCCPSRPQCLRSSHQPAASEGPLEKDRVQASCARWGTQSCGVSTNAGGKCPGGCPPRKHLTQFPLIKIQVHKHQSWREQVAPWGPATRPRLSVPHRLQPPHTGHVWAGGRGGWAPSGGHSKTRLSSDLGASEAELRCEEGAAAEPVSPGGCDHSSWLSPEPSMV